MSNALRNIVAGGAIIADCDGTIAPIVESAHGLCMSNVVKRASENAGIEYSQSFFDEVWASELGKGILNFTKVYHSSLDPESADRFLSEIGSLEAAEGLYEEEYILFSEQPENSSYFEMRKGLKELFEGAAADGLPVAVLSNANQRVLQATLTATFRLAGMGDYRDYIPVVMGKDAIEGQGFKAKPDRGAVICVQSKLQDQLGRAISLGNSIGLGDTPNDFKAFRAAGVGRILACENERDEGHLDGPDVSGYLIVGAGVNVVDAVNRFATSPDAHHRAPKLARG